MCFLAVTCLVLAFVPAQSMTGRHQSATEVTCCTAQPLACPQRVVEQLQLGYWRLERTGEGSVGMGLH